MNDQITITLLMYMTVPGAAGGLTSFLVALKNNHYKNNKYVVKVTVEVLGGAITATALTFLLRNSEYVLVMAFVIGTAWAHILQRIRVRTTKIVEAALGNIGTGQNELDTPTLLSRADKSFGRPAESV